MGGAVLVWEMTAIRHGRTATALYAWCQGFRAEAVFGHRTYDCDGRERFALSRGRRLRYNITFLRSTASMPWDGAHAVPSSRQGWWTMRWAAVYRMPGGSSQAPAGCCPRGPRCQTAVDDTSDL